MTILQQFLDDGWNVLVSPLVEELKPFGGRLHDGDQYTIVFHPRDYNYVAEEDFMVAHTANMASIYARIESMAEKANERIDELTDWFNNRSAVLHVMLSPGAEVVEGKDGLYTLVAKAFDKRHQLNQKISREVFE